MKNCHRMGDCNDAGGCITSIPQGDVFANNLLVSIDGSEGTSHMPFYPPHLQHMWYTANGSPTVFAHNTPVNRQGDADTCAHVRVAGSPNVFVGDSGNFSYQGSVDSPQAPQDPDDPDDTPGTGTPVTTPSGGTPAIPIVTTPPNPIDTDPTPPPPPEDPGEVDCNVLDQYPDNYNFMSIADQLQLSRHFKLAHLTSRAVFAHYIPTSGNRGLTAKQIVQNLCFLARTVLDPLKDQYPNMFITSGFRNASGSSQHNIGQAADVQFSGWSSQPYWDGAHWVKDNIPYDQFILEYGGRNPWFHVSANPNGNRGKVNTFDGRTYHTGLIRFR